MKRIRNVVQPLIFLASCVMIAGCGGSASSPAAAPATVSTVVASPAVNVNLPAAPTGVTAVSGINKVILSWNAVPGADSYNIYWSTDPRVTTTNGTKITGVSSPYHHVGLYVSRVYFYIVTAVSSSGESSPSDQASTVAATDSENLYSAFCASCHGSVTSTTIMGGTAERITAAIANNTGGMGSLSSLTSAQITSISQQLPCH